MKLLLDTHLLLWAAGQFKKLSPKTRTLLNDNQNELLFSPASLWKITIKNASGRKDFQVDPHLFRRGLIDNGYTELPITSEHVVTINELPEIHKDPFDRILIAQSIVEGIILLTSDPIILKYSGPIRSA